MNKKVSTVLTVSALVFSMTGSAFAAEAATEAAASASQITAGAGFDEESGLAWTMVLDPSVGKVFVHQYYADQGSGTGLGVTTYSGVPTSTDEVEEGVMDVHFTDDEDGQEYVLSVANVDDFTTDLTLGENSVSITQVDPKVADIGIGLTFFVGVDAAGNDVAVGYNQAGDTFYYCGYMKEDPSTPVESQFSDVTMDQDDQAVIFHLTGNDGSGMDAKIEPADETGLSAYITLGDDEPFAASWVDLMAFPAYAEAVNTQMVEDQTE